jgi:dihydrodipicolinate synthase/N-acetylneuraminate lyase
MVKSTYGTVEPVHDLKTLVGDRMAIFYGSFLAAFEGLCAGAHGWTSGILNVVTPAAKAMREAITVENDVHKGFQIWKRILAIVHLWTYQQLGPISDLAIYRWMLNFWGLKGGYCRDPFSPLDPSQESKLHAFLEKSGWIDPDHALDNIQ